MQLEAESVLEYIVDNTVGMDATASSLAARYDLSGKLGEGAFSQVWRGQRLGGGEPCALKCIGLESLDDDDGVLVKWTLQLYGHDSDTSTPWTPQPTPRGGCDSVAVSGSDYNSGLHGTYLPIGRCEDQVYYQCSGCSS